MIDTGAYQNNTASGLERVMENWAWAAKQYRGWIKWGDATPPSGIPVLLLKENTDGKAVIVSYGFLSDKNEWVFVEDEDNPLNEWHYWSVPCLPPMWQDKSQSFDFHHFVI